MEVGVAVVNPLNAPQHEVCLRLIRQERWTRILREVPDDDAS